MQNSHYVYNDGGRAEAGFKGTTGDCVTRSIAIATEKPYQEVYDALHQLAKQYAKEKRDRVAKSILKSGASPRNGVHREIYQLYMESLGWEWVSTMQVGKGCQTHLVADELPSGRIVARLSRHLAAVVDGVVHDIYDCTRGGNRCVYGYFQKSSTALPTSDEQINNSVASNTSKKNALNEVFEWTDDKVLAFTKIATLGSYGDYDGCRKIEDKLKRFKELNS